MYHFYPQLLLRTPAYPHSTHSEADLQSLLTDLYFRAAVFLASPGLYRELEKKAFRLQALPSGVVFTLRKYLNRMCYRPTPFGLFSGVAVAEWSCGYDHPLLLSSAQVRVKASLGYGQVQHLARELLEGELAPYQTYQASTSLYRVQDAYRTLRYEQGDGKRTFFVDETASQRLLKALLDFCREGRTRAAIVSFIMAYAQAGEEESSGYFEQLTAQQLLVSTLEANITGEDYLHRLLALCRRLRLEGPRVEAGARLQDQLAGISEAEDRESIGAAVLQVGRKAQLPGKTASPLYVNLDGGTALGGLATTYQRSLLDGLQCLDRLVPGRQPQGLESFAGSFRKKFENRAVPLLQALDPEAGVGYEALAESYGSPRLLEGISWTAPGTGNTAVEWTPAHILLFKKWCTAGDAGAAIELAEQDLEGLPEATPASALPPSISVLFRVMQDKVFIEQAGGASAISLAGRFTPLNEQIHKMAGDIAQEEERANPQVLFAEIAHLCEEHTANIDRRNTIRSYEIPVLVQSTLPPERQIPLSDLWVKVVAGRVVLFSRRLKKEIIPRLSSAFNYTRNDLAVFRFLCDLQYQGLKGGFTLEMSSLFPGMSYYPRVVYRSAVLHLATWHLQKTQLEALFVAPSEQGPCRLEQLATRLGWPRYVALTEHDHQLVADLEEEGDRLLLLQALKNKERAVIREFPFVSDQVVVDRENRPYVNQFVAALYHRREVYPGIGAGEEGLQVPSRVRRKLLPGSGWLYFKIYCHPSRSNQLLTTFVLPAVRQLQRKGQVSGWFFVRYRDPDYHLRVRLAVLPEEAGMVLQAFSRKMKPLVEKGTVGDFQVAVYERELERYGEKRMEAAEKWFCSSSALIAAYIRKTGAEESDYSYYSIGFSGLEDMAGAFYGDLRERERFFHGLYSNFFQEFEGGKALKEQLTAAYRRMGGAALRPGQEKQDVLAGMGAALQCQWEEALGELAQKARSLSPEKKAQLLADLMHMHLNRLFVDEPRKQELVVYYCFWRHYKSLLARSRA